MKKQKKIEDIINLPRDRATINSWARSFYTIEYKVDEFIQKHKSAILKKITAPLLEEETMDFLLTEYLVVGEAFSINDTHELLNPDYVSVKKDPFTGNIKYSLRPDENTRRRVLSNDTNGIDEKIILAIKSGKNLPLENVHHIANRVMPYELRGTSILVPHFKQFLLRDFNIVCDEDVFQNRCTIHAVRVDKFLNKIIN